MVRKILIVGAGKSTSYLLEYLLGKSREEHLQLNIGDLHPESIPASIGAHPASSQSIGTSTWSYCDHTTFDAVGYCALNVSLVVSGTVTPSDWSVALYGSLQENSMLRLATAAKILSVITKI